VRYVMASIRSGWEGGLLLPEDGGRYTIADEFARGGLAARCDLGPMMHVAGNSTDERATSKPAAKANMNCEHSLASISSMKRVPFWLRGNRAGLLAGRREPPSPYSSGLTSRRARPKSPRLTFLRFAAVITPLTASYALK